MPNNQFVPSLVLSNPQDTVDQIIQFIKKTHQEQSSKAGLIAVSGGVDSALSLSLLTRALGPANVYPVFLPHGDQSVVDAELVVNWNSIPQQNWQNINIQPLVAGAAEALQISTQSPDHATKLRLGNIMARMRMVVMYDLAKQLSALVCGTENKSEKYLGYFTRFGDEASDLEPLQHLYKTQVWQLAELLELPPIIVKKTPSAGLWPDQTDETELGFSYEAADKVIAAVVDAHRDPANLEIVGLDQTIVQKVLKQIKKMAFKQQVPFMLKNDTVNI